jgi:hypothetical protein
MNWRLTRCDSGTQTFHDDGTGLLLSLLLQQTEVLIFGASELDANDFVF